MRRGDEPPHTLRCVQEEYLQLVTRWVLIQAALGVPLIYTQIRKFASRVLQPQGASRHGTTAGKCWMARFLRSNTVLQTQRAAPLPPTAPGARVGQPHQAAVFRKSYNFHPNLGDSQEAMFETASTRTIVTHRNGSGRRNLSWRAEALA